MAEAAAPALGGELPISDQTSKEVRTHKRGGRDVAGGREGIVCLNTQHSRTSPPPTHTTGDSQGDGGVGGAVRNDSRHGLLGRAVDGG